MIGVNRIGSDGNGIDYTGDSMVVDPRGEVMCSPEPNEEKLGTVTLLLREVKDFRNKFPVSLDADEFELTL